jgi:predicted AlkP superfamily pyrophosphatase or phosphodiesterase
MKRHFPGRATLVVVSDHGFSPISRAILPNVILRQAGLVEISGKEIVGGVVRVVPQGGCAMLYITGAEGDAAKRDAIVEKVRAAFRDAPGVAKIIDPAHLKDYGVADPKDDPHAPDMLLFAEMGCVFGDTAAGDLPFIDKPERSGSHGHDPHLPDLHATFVAWGANVDAGVNLGEIANTDVAPTIARLLRIDFPRATGKPLPLSPHNLP